MRRAAVSLPGMSGNNVLPWGSLERWRGRLFLLGAAILVGAAAIALYDVVQGTEVRLPLGQVFVGAGWAAVSLGMLGLYPDLRERNRWLGRICAVLVAIGVFGYVVMAVLYAAASLGGLPESTLEGLAPVFLPGVLVGTLLAFPAVAVGCLLADIQPRAVGVLLFAPPVVFVANVLTGPNPESIFGVLVALILVFGTLGYLLRTASPGRERTQPAPGPTAE